MRPRERVSSSAGMHPVREARSWSCPGTAAILALFAVIHRSTAGEAGRQASRHAKQVGTSV